MKTRFESYFTKFEGRCWMWCGAKNNKGYGLFWSNQKLKLAHRVSWEIYNGPITNGLQALHKCDVAACVNPNHLFLGTIKDNMKDMVSKGRSQKTRGIQKALSKLTEKQVQEIRSLYLSVMNQKELGIKFNVSDQTISRIVRRKIWKHV